jgi:phosphatidate phosphatase PAH1
VTSTIARPEHRGRDVLVAEGDPQSITATFAYGPTDKDLIGEDVDVFLERGCAGAWEKLGTATTTDGGGVVFDVPGDKVLERGRHRVRLVVAGDRSHTDLIVEVVRRGAPIFVSDVDGTLTESETAEFPRLLEGTLPTAHPDAAAVLRTLADKGYLAVYLTARPEWLTRRTRAFLEANGFPPGIVRTTSGLTGHVGDSAALFKSLELAELRRRGFLIAWAFGNQPSDTDAYEAASIQPRRHRVFVGLDDRHGGRRIDAYRELLSDVAEAESVCE